MLLRGKLLKRGRQVRFLTLNFAEHWNCSRAILQSRQAGAMVGTRFTAFKYLGDYLALSMSVAERRRVLTGHYQSLEKIVFASTQRRRPGRRGSLLIWEAHVDEHGPLRIFLESAKLAPMEGELQLRFCAGTRDLYTLTFLLAPGDVFDSSEEVVLYIGGIQGAVGRRLEMRHAAKSNGEIAPSAMLLLVIRSLAKVLGIGEIYAIGEDDHISKSYASEQMKLDYRAFWTHAGGVRRGRFYSLPNDSPERPLHEISPSHRSRTRRKRERKGLIREDIEARLRLVMVSSGGSGLKNKDA